MAELWKREVPSNTQNPEDGFTAYRKISFNAEGMTALTKPEIEAIIWCAEGMNVLNAWGASELIDSFEFDNRGLLHVSRDDLSPMLGWGGYSLVANDTPAGFNGAR